MYGNPDELDRIAGEIEKRADGVRDRAKKLDDDARKMEWHSVAAERCRETVGGDRRQLEKAADGLTEAAALLRRHAQEVRELIAMIKKISEAVVGWFTSAIDRFNRAVDAFNQAAKDFANGVADVLGFGGGQPPQPPQPPWTGWKWGPDNLPPAGGQGVARGRRVPAWAGGARVSPAPHRLVLTAGELAYLVERTGVDLPPGWRPSADIGPAESGLIKKRVVDGVGGEVHRSVVKNLEILALPMVMLDTVAAIGDKGLHSMHTVSGPLGASLFELGDGAVEMSMFASADLGKELIRAVPPESQDTNAGIESRLGGGGPEQAPLRGRLPLAALQEMGTARLFREADPGGPAAVVARLNLSGGEAALAQQVATETDGALRCLVVGRNGMTSQVSWVHTDGGWSGLDPEPDGSGRRMVRLEPAEREDLGTWVAPAVAGAL